MLNNISKKLTQFPTQLLLLVVGAALFIPFIGNVPLFDWDEVNFAESAREMLLTGNYRMVQIDFQPFYEKPPLFIWLQAFSMSVFGVNEFAARLPNAICGIATMLVVFNVGRSVFNSRFGIFWALIFAASFLPQIYFKSGIIDPVFNLLIFIGIYFLYKLTVENEFEDRKTKRRNKRLHLFISGLAIGLAVLTKGPVAILIVVLTALNYFIIHRGKLRLEIGQAFMWLMVVFFVVSAWLSFELWENGVKFLYEFIAYQIKLFKTEDAGHGGPFYFHFIVVLIGCFPASALIFSAFKKNEHDDFAQMLLKRWMVYLLAVVLIVFSVVRTKIIHYSSLSYFPITFLAAYYLNYLFEGKMKWTWKQTVPLVSIALLIGSTLTGAVQLIKRTDVFINYIKDDFAVACLSAPVHWGAADIWFGILFAVTIVAAVILVQFGHVRWAVYAIIVSSAIFVNSVMIFFVPRIERYSQHAMIEFLKSKQNEDCFIEVTGFKSYAHYFYGLKLPEKSIDRNEVLFGKFENPVYIITKVNRAEDLKTYQPFVEEIYRKNGFVFFKRIPHD
jgi:4-amino-4-deoxy-L-arabinose transferase-like glycosyltransferase